MKIHSEFLESLEREISSAITLWVVALHTLIHLVTLVIQATATIYDTPSTLPLHRLTSWTTGEWFLGVSILSMVFVVSTVVMGIFSGERSYPWAVAIFQVALAFGTCVYAMILNQLFPFMMFGR
jgi:hypothetical protein